MQGNAICQFSKRRGDGILCVAAIEEFLQERQEMHRKWKHNLTVAQERIPKFVYKKRSEISLGVGDWVYLKLQPYRQTEATKSVANSNPFEVLEKVGTVAGGASGI